MAAAKQIRLDAAVAAVLLESGGNETLKDKQKRLFLVDKMFSLYSRLVLARV